MGLFSQLGNEYEQVVFGHEPSAGLRTIIAVYSTARGPALGGTRFWSYPDEEAALADALRLGKAMAFKAACAGLALGGGKAVVIGNAATDKTPELLAAYARVVDGMGGAYITTADVGTNVADLDLIAQHTRFVTGTSKGSGDPSPVTAHGVWHGMRATAAEAFGSADLEGKHVVVQGLGKVGGALARLLAADGARLTLADIDGARAAALAEELGAQTVEPKAALVSECDILAPCALGPVVTDATVNAMRCKAIAGAANNQLATPEHGRKLAERGIVYAPDYVVNAGGLINVEDELHGYDAARALAKAEAIADTVHEVFGIARAENLTPADAADRLAVARIREASRK